MDKEGKLKVNPSTVIRLMHQISKKIFVSLPPTDFLFHNMNAIGDQTHG